MEYNISMGRSNKVGFIEVCMDYLIDQLKLTNSKWKVIITQDSNLRKTNQCSGATASLGGDLKLIVITLYSKLPFHDTLILLSHEMVHAKQFATGKLRVDMVRGKPVRVWLGKRASKKTHYYDQPWEKQAYGLERNLANGFLKEYEHLLDIK